jgi:tetratricopeptide (TPR) repeat protein
MRNRLILAISALALTVGTAAAGPYSPVSLGIAPEEYFGVVYASAPIDQHPFMFYAGETIRFKVDFFNSSESTQLVSLGGRRADQLFTLDISKDGAPIAPQWRLLAVDYEDRSGLSPASLGATLSLAPGARLIIHGELQSLPADSGVYLVEVSTPLVDTSEQPIAPQSTLFDFELRLPRSTDAAEQSRRKALEALGGGQLAQAETFAGQIAARNPDSLAAASVRAQIAQAQGRTAEALALYRRALEILERNQDSQYLNMGSSERDDQITGFRTIIQGLEGR